MTVLIELPGASQRGSRLIQLGLPCRPRFMVDRCVALDPYGRSQPHGPWPGALGRPATRVQAQCWMADKL